ncbi:MAG: hypothetical protein EON60_01045 [Alphaproteobacteria bacterium]|nr:MAG: hypothetical protein EON60_01045 [Alphaproteobacteria bacterium]
MTQHYVVHVLTGVIVLIGLLYVTLATISAVVYLKKLPTPHGLKYTLRTGIALAQMTLAGVWWYGSSLGIFSREPFVLWIFVMVAAYAGWDLWAAHRDYRNRHDTRAYET